MTRPLLLLAALAAVTIPTHHHRHGQHTAAAAAPPHTSPSPNTPRTTATRASRSRAPGPLRSRSRRSSGTGSLLHWAALRECENSSSYRSKPSDQYRGAYQFDRTTWASVDGSGDPAAASPAEQDLRAQLLFNARGRQPWPVCGRFL